MKTYSTYAGAYRAANGKPILRLLHDPQELFVVLPSAETRIMAVSGRVGASDGSTTYEEIALND